MKSVCKSLKTSIICTSLFLLVTIIMSVAVVNYDSIITNIILNISIGFLGSSFVALLLSIPSYSVATIQDIMLLGYLGRNKARNSNL